jgi:hypothetical protein
MVTLLITATIAASVFSAAVSTEKSTTASGTVTLTPPASLPASAPASLAPAQVMVRVPLPLLVNVQPALDVPAVSVTDVPSEQRMLDVPS